MKENRHDCSDSIFHQFVIGDLDFIHAVNQRIQFQGEPPMMQTRVFPSISYLSLKAAFRRLTKAAGGQESAASITRVDFQRIGRYGRPHETMFAPTDVVADLEADAGDPLVTRAMADLQGYLLVPKPPAEGDLEWVKHLGALGKESGEAIVGLSKIVGCGDTTITANEIQKMELRREVAEAMEVLAQIDKALEMVERGEIQR